MYNSILYGLLKWRRESWVPMGNEEITPTDASNEAIRIRIAKEGGTNLGAAVAFSFGFIIMIMVVEACAP